MQENQINELVTKDDLNFVLNLVFEQNYFKTENIIDSNVQQCGIPESVNEKKDDKLIKETKSTGKVDKSNTKLNIDLNKKLIGEIKGKLSSKGNLKLFQNSKGSKSNSKLEQFKNLENSKIEEINSDSNYFKQHLINLINNSVGLKKSNPPFDCHPDLIKKYLNEVHNIKKIHLTNQTTNSLSLQFVVLDAKIEPKKEEHYDPYFKVYQPGKLNKTEAYKSKHYLNELNPKWNELFYVPVTRKNIDQKEVIRIEIWDHDPKTICGALKDFKKAKNCRFFWKKFKDLFEVLFSNIFQIQIDDRIGECWINLNEIPATGTKLSTSILDQNLNEKGTIRLNLDWRFLSIKNKQDKLISILMHMKLYVFCLNLHLELEHNDTIKELKIEKINYVRLFYVTELTLINQNRLQNCLTDYEDGIIRRAIVIRTILRLPSAERNGRLLLSSMLCNEDLDTPESLIWIHFNYVNQLREFEKDNLTDLVQFYTTRFDAFKCLCFSREFDCETLDILQFLRTIVKYEKCYPDAKFDVKVNSELKNYIIGLINEMIADSKEWTQLANKLDFLDENLEKYWQRNIQKVIDKESTEKIRTNYERIVYGLVKSKINEWSKIKNSTEQTKFRLLNNQLITWYFFCKNFEFILFDNSNSYRFKQGEMNTKLDTKLDDTKLNKKLGTKSDTKLDIKIDTKSDTKLDMKSDTKLDMKSDTKLDQRTTEEMKSKNLTTQPILNERTDNQLEKPELNQIKLVESSNSELKATNLTEQEEGEHNEDRLININSLTFCDLIATRSINSNLSNVFPKRLFVYWMNDRVNDCMQLSKVIADKEIKKLIKIIKKFESNELNSNYSSVENYFYEALTETVYFYISLQYYDDELFERTIDKFCECLFKYVEDYKNSIVTSHKLLKSSKRIVLLIAIGINELGRLNDKLLNKILIQILTDVPADEVWNCIENYRKLIREKNKGNESKKKIKEDAKKDYKNDKQIIETLNSTSSKLIIKICFRIKYTVNQINDLIKGLIESLGKQIIIEFEIGLNEILNSKDVRIMFQVVEQLDLKLKQFSNYLINQQNVVDLIYFIKHNIDLNLRNTFLELCNQYVEEVKTKKPVRHLTKIKIIKIINIFKKLKEFFKLKVDSFDEDTKKLMNQNKFLIDSYVDSEEFSNLIDKLFKF